MMTLEFVAMTDAYAKDALALYNAYVLTSTATFSIAPLNKGEMDHLLFTGLKRFPSYAIIADGEFAGYVMLNRYKPREAYDQTAEVTLYLDEFFHGRGIGSQAMSFIETFAKEHDFRALLGVICAENDTSIHLFKKHDYFQCAHFKEVGKKFGKVLDIVIYEKLLS